MSFWNRVLTIIESKDINKKTLASSVGIDPSTISKGLKDGTLPNAETAVRIAQFLNTTVEFLVTGKDVVLSSSTSQNLDTLYKYSSTIYALDRIPEASRDSIVHMICELDQKTRMPAPDTSKTYSSNHTNRGK